MTDLYNVRLVDVNVRTMFLILCLLALNCAAHGTQSKFYVDIDNKTSSFRLLVDSKPWLVSGNTFFSHDGHQYSTADQTLKLLIVASETGEDQVGRWHKTAFDYQGGTLSVKTSIKTYDTPQLPLAIFSQTYIGPATNTSSHDVNSVISSFPSFRTLPSENLGYLSYAGDMVGYKKLSIGSWDTTSNFTTGIEGGPLVIFDNTSNVLVISPMSQFMAASNQLSQKNQELWFGIMGLVDNVPSGYSMDFIVYYSSDGINQAIKNWGEFLRFWYNKEQNYRYSSLTLNYMGYWTDNGAFYYYNTESGKNYEATIIDVAGYLRQQKIPFRYTHYDSWWYAKGHENGTISWTPLPSIIPDGFKSLAEKTQVPFSCHNKFWDNQTTYAKYNGGQYNFVPDPVSGLAVPDDDKFWLDLFNMTQQWGPFIMYEQDWLSRETELNQILLTDLELGRRWLVGMGRGASAYKNIEIQYCTATSQHILQSLEISTVTQARVSRDYSPGGKQWDIGITSMFADAVGLAPFKDTFWTTEIQPGSPYKDKTEKQTMLNSLIATLSTGPVAIGDGIGLVNKTLLMRCCDSSGKILQPSKPLTAVDDQIKKSAFPSYPGPEGEVYTTYSNISGFLFGIVMAAEMINQYSLTPSNGWTFAQLPQSVIYSGTSPTPAPQTFSDDNPLKLGPECSAVNFCLYYTSPVLQLSSSSKVILLGEENKWVPLSSKRFLGINQSSEDIIVSVYVNPEETVYFRYLQDSGPVLTVVCDNSKSSTPATHSFISLAEKKCYLQ